MVTGKVTDGDNGEPLVGVSVVIRGTTNGTITDFNGKYTLDVDQPDATLSFSFVGYINQEEIVANRSIIDVKLSPDLTQLSEVVVIGYGTANAKDVTGAVSKLSAENFNGTNVNSAEQIMQGKIAGVNVSFPGGQLGQGTRIRIRGV